MTPPAASSPARPSLRGRVGRRRSGRHRAGRTVQRSRSPSAGDIVVIVRAAGFAEERQSIGSGAARRDLAMVLTPATVLETITVTPTRGEQRMGDTPASVNVIDRDDIRQSPAVVADDVLRRMPTFSLFRRTSSLSSHPTTQGVSLRGIGPSGVSRTLVLLDGVPFNDPFGGWVYWTRVPLEATDRIELVDGSSSSLYGNFAMGGVINIVTAPPARRTLDMRTQYGNSQQPEVRRCRQRRVGQGRRVGRCQRVQARTAFRSSWTSIRPASPSAGGWTTTRRSISRTSTSGSCTTRPSGRDVSSASATSAKSATTARSARSTARRRPTTRTWTSVSGGARLHLPDQSELQATVFFDSRDVPQQLPRRAGGDATAQHRPDDAQPAGADERQRRHVPVDAARSTAGTSFLPAATGAGWTATAKRTASTPRPARRSC